MGLSIYPSIHQLKFHRFLSHSLRQLSCDTPWLPCYAQASRRRTVAVIRCWLWPVVRLSCRHSPVWSGTPEDGGKSASAAESPLMRPRTLGQTLQSSVRGKPSAGPSASPCAAVVTLRTAALLLEGQRSRLNQQRRYSSNHSYQYAQSASQNQWRLRKTGKEEPGAASGNYLRWPARRERFSWEGGRARLAARERDSVPGSHDLLVPPLQVQSGHLRPAPVRLRGAIREGTEADRAENQEERCETAAEEEEEERETKSQ